MITIFFLVRRFHMLRLGRRLHRLLLMAFLLWESRWHRLSSVVLRVSLLDLGMLRVLLLAIKARLLVWHPRTLVHRSAARWWPEPAPRLASWTGLRPAGRRGGTAQKPGIPRRLRGAAPP